MASDQLYLFAALAAFSRDIQDRLRQVQAPEAIVSIAAENGFSITLEQLRYYAASLNGDHWIWAHKSQAWRERFFSQTRQLDLQAV